MNNENSTLSRFNDQYLKCIVTTHSGMIQALKNKGALIVYQTKENDERRNYIYLGNEFLASGYGFKNKDMLTKAEDIVSTYDQKHLEVDNSINNINQTLSEIEQNVNDTLSRYRAKLIITDNDNNEIDLNDIYFHGKPAYYEDMSIKKIDVNISYFDGETHTNETLNIVDNTIYLPIGSIITNINYVFQFQKNDSAGINKLSVGYYSSSEQSLNNDILSQTFQETQFNNASSIISFSLNLKLNFNINSNEKMKIIDLIEISVKETPESKYKEYPELLTKDEYRMASYKIYSLENMILDHTKLIIDSLYVKGIGQIIYHFKHFDFEDTSSDNYYYVKSSTNTEDTKSDTLNKIKSDLMSGKESEETEQQQRYTSMGIKYLYNINKDDINDVYIDINNASYNVFTLFVNKNFDIHFAEYITETSEYNWTGAFGRIPYDITIAYGANNNTYNVNSVKTKIYQIKLTKSNLSTNTGKLHLKLICNNNDLKNTLFETGQQNTFKEPVNWDLLYNDYFLTTHWSTFYYDDDTNTSYNGLKNKLEKFKYDF